TAGNDTADFPDKERLQPKRGHGLAIRDAFPEIVERGTLESERLTGIEVNQFELVVGFGFQLAQHGVALGVGSLNQDEFGGLRPAEVRAEAAQSEGQEKAELEIGECGGNAISMHRV